MCSSAYASADGHLQAFSTCQSVLFSHRVSKRVRVKIICTIMGKRCSLLSWARGQALGGGLVRVDGDALQEGLRLHVQQRLRGPEQAPEPACQRRAVAARARCPLTLRSLRNAIL